MRVIVACGVVCLGAWGCKTECAREPDPAALEVQIGLSGGPDGLDFVPLAKGGELPLETFGQGGTHITFAVRCLGLGVNRAYLDSRVTNLETGEVIESVPMSRPSLWLCDEAREVCDQTKVLIMTGGLTEPGVPKDGLRVRVTAEVREGDRSAMGSREGVLRKTFGAPEPGPTLDAGLGPQRDPEADAGEP